MKISTKTRYAIRAMGELSLHYNEGAISLKKVSEAQKISLKYLENIMSELKGHKLVISVAGKKGGYILSRSPDKITIADIFCIFEGDVIDCLENKDLCDATEECPARKIYSEINTSIKKTLQEKTLQNIFIEQSTKND